MALLELLARPAPAGVVAPDLLARVDVALLDLDRRRFVELLAGEPELLASCYRRSLELALAHSIRTIAFPAISCGVYGYPMERAAGIAVRECSRFAREHDAIERITFALFGSDALAIYQAELTQLMP